MKKQGEISSPVRTEFGVHLIQLVEENRTIRRPYEEVKDGLIEKLRNNKRKEVRTKVYEEMAAANTIKIESEILGQAISKAKSARK